MGAISLFTTSCVYANIQIPSNLNSAYVPNDSVTKSVGGQIIWIAQLIMYTVAVIIVMFAGLKYMWAAPESKAEFKKKLIYMVGGAVILFAAGALVQLVGNIAFKNI